MDQNETIVSSRPVLEMLTVANEYCLFFENAEKYPVEEILGYFNKIAPLLYLKGVILPDIAPDEDSFGERFVTEEQWEVLFKILREKFGDLDVYYALDRNNDSVESSLADNMADIYQDMKDFVLLFQKNQLHCQKTAIASLRHLMFVHWGPVLLGALKAVHQLLYLSPSFTDHEADPPSWLF